MNKFNRNFPNYDDDSDYNTNANSYYKDLGRKTKLIKLLAKRIWEYDNTLNETLEEIEKRLNDYISENDVLMSERLKNWDKRIDELDEEVSNIFVEWLNDGTLEQIINHDVLGNKADKIYVDELNETVQDLKPPTTVSSKKIRPVITILDDDAWVDTFTRLKPISEEKGVPFCTAAIAERVGNQNHMTFEQLHTLQDMGWEVMSHSFSHPTGKQGLLEYANDLNRLEYEIGEGGKGTLENEGLNISGFVYPQNATNFTIRRIVKNHYKYAFGGQSSSSETPGFNDDTLMDNAYIKRIAFGSFTTQNPTVNGNDEQDTLAYYKACVDYAVEHRAWLVLMTHVSAQTTAEDQMLSDIIDYIQSLNVDILTARDAFEIHGNRYFAGDFETSYTVVDKHGQTHSSFNEQFPIIKGKNNDVLMSDKIASFQSEAITLNVIRQAYAYENNFPEPLAGTLYTYFIDPDFHRYNYQEYHTSARNVYKRFCKDDTGNEWGDWVLLTTEDIVEKHTVNLEEQTVPANSSIDIKIDIPQAHPDNTIINGNPAWGIGNLDLLYNVTVTDVGVINIRIFNFSDSSKTITARDWLFSISSKN